MPITVACKCGQKLRANDEQAGKQTKCPKCGEMLTLAGVQVPAFDVFVSYSTKDKLTADALCATFESNGLRCWIAPRDIMPGINWGEAIIKGIEQCRVMVLVFSAHANESSQVKREVERAVGKGLPVIPVRIEDVKPSRAMEYFISSQHWLDALTPPLEKHLQELARTVARLLADEVLAIRQPEPSKPLPVAAPVAAAHVVAVGRGRLPRWAWIAAAASILLLLAGIGIYVLTDYGTIRIELSNADADVDIQVDDGTVTTRRAGDLMRLRVGEHSLVVTGKDYETVRSSFIVKRGDNAPLKLTLASKTVAKVPGTEPGVGNLSLGDRAVAQSLRLGNRLAALQMLNAAVGKQLESAAIAHLAATEVLTFEERLAWGIAEAYLGQPKQEEIAASLQALKLFNKNFTLGDATVFTSNQAKLFAQMTREQHQAAVDFSIQRNNSLTPAMAATIVKVVSII
jgi:hypothetical protein